MTSYNSYATLEFPEISNEAIKKIEVEASECISWKHPGLKKRRVSGKRQKQNLGLPAEPQEELICLEIRK